jgi:hypothetical protein
VIETAAIPLQRQPYPFLSAFPGITIFTSPSAVARDEVKNTPLAAILNYKRKLRKLPERKRRKRKTARKCGERRHPDHFKEKNRVARLRQSGFKSA